VAADLPPGAETVELRDGTRVVLRAIRPDDAPRLQAFHARLSPESIYLRWLSAHATLTDEEAQALSRLDTHNQMAFVAALPQAGGEAIIGVAHYAVVATDSPLVADTAPGVAEAAVVVADAYQQRGLGSLLLGRLLTYARAHGVTTWIAEINVANARMLRFIQRGGLPTTRRLESGSWQVTIHIAS
jgi:acetyltransferase